ncbi:FecCD family ABC transporter permease [Stutzerimonas azotifigens]|nr:iron ABC transporter permease [Stutzerimonas azotifigens]
MRQADTSLRYSALIALLLATLGLSSLLSLGLGAAQMSPDRLLGILAYKAGLAPAGNWSAGQEHIVWLIRAPRVLLGMFVGAGLALIGSALQAATRNPLADPHLLGVSSGAALGAVIVILYLGEFIGAASLPLAAFLGALGSTFMVLLVARRGGRFDGERLVLSGVAVSFVLSALTSLLLFTGDHRAASSVIFWMLGGLGSARWELVWLPAVSVVAAGMALVAWARPLNALMAGEQTAVSLGVSPARLRLFIFVSTSALTAVLVSLTGAIGFVGLMIPHMARRLVGADHRRLIPVAALMGALFVVWVDAFARTALAPEDLPIGIGTGLLGGLYFIYLLWRRDGR